MTSAEFTMAMFEMTEATNIKTEDRGVTESKRYDVDKDMKITIPYEVQAGSVQISGLELDATEGETAPESGKFKVKITASAEDTAGTTEITFAAADFTAGTAVRVAYRRRIVDGKVITTPTTAKSVKGRLEMEWPVYSSGTDCTESAIKAKLHKIVYRVRVTAKPGFSNSYKTAATNAVTFATIDPQRADGKLSDLIYEELDSNGGVVTKSANEVNWD